MTKKKVEMYSDTKITFVIFAVMIGLLLLMYFFGGGTDVTAS